MNLKEIVFRKDEVPIDTEESLFILKEYIKIRKNLSVDMNISNRRGMIGITQELNLMGQMFCYAVGWLKTNWKKEYE